MPSKSAEQHRLMEAVAHDRDFARKAGIPQSVGREFANADKARGLFAARKCKKCGAPAGTCACK